MQRWRKRSIQPALAAKLSSVSETPCAEPPLRTRKKPLRPGPAKGSYYPAFLVAEIVSRRIITYRFSRASPASYATLAPFGDKANRTRPAAQIRCACHIMCMLTFCLKTIFILGWEEWAAAGAPG